FSRLGKPFISPSPSLSPDIVVPPQHVKWLLGQPSSVLAQRPALWEGMAIRYMFPSADPAAEFVPALVKRHMSPAGVDGMQADMYRELRRWTDAGLGTDTERWAEIALFDTLGTIMKRVGQRLYFGAELGSSDELGRVLQKLANWSGLGGLVIGQFSPAVFRRPLGWLFRIPLGYYTRAFKRIWEPAVRAQLEAGQLSGDGSATAGAVEALAGTKRHTVESISSNFMIMPGTLALLLNLITQRGAEARAFMPLLRHEVDTVFSQPTAWTDSGTFTARKMPLATAFARESMRYSPLAASIPVRAVVAPGGVLLPDGTTHVPRGARLACPAEAMTRDERFVPRPHVFDPFRFLEVDDDDEGGRRYRLKADSDIVDVSESFLFFGFGRHAW
ncbi:cytochrome P450, partial [Lasiosphaeria miniovina]